ncbi:MAG: M48 family metallopeptidase [Candidatus Nomurabacteria bacterium]|nr:M48 family metallopeptidase [Candidatus Nomurabacteria bacterium]
MAALFSRRPERRLKSITSISDREFGDIKVTRAHTSRLAIKIEPNGAVEATIPRYATLISLRALIDKNRAKLRRNLKNLPQIKHYSESEIKQIRRKAHEFLPARVDFLARRHGFRYAKVSLRNQKTRWGSCSSKNNLSLNIALVLLRPELIDYVILHELAHTKHKNHSADFWRCLENVLPNYKNLRRELKKHTTFLK